MNGRRFLASIQHSLINIQLFLNGILVGSLGSAILVRMQHPEIGNIKYPLIILGLICFSGIIQIATKVIYTLMEKERPNEPRA